MLTRRRTTTGDAEVIEALNQIVAQHSRWGFWKCFDRLRLQGVQVESQAGASGVLRHEAEFAAPDQETFAEPNRQNAYIESFNGRFRDEYLNDHWFSNLAQASGLIQFSGDRHLPDQQDEFSYIQLVCVPITSSPIHHVDKEDQLLEF